MSAPVLTRADMKRLLPPRPADSHKGRNGKLLLFVGSSRYTGAALLCAAAALRAGAGITTAAVPRDLKHAFAALPEVCCAPVGDGGEWNNAALLQAAAMLADSDALAMGCGMANCENESLLCAALDTNKPLVIDADGLNLLAAHPALLRRALHDKVVLTPHPGEMARLTGRPAADIAKNAEDAARAAAGDWGCTVLLKGHVSHIAAGGRLIRSAAGNSGLAKGGSGDVLTGVIAALLAQGLTAFDAACLGAYLLGVSADRAYKALGERMLIARDVISAVENTIQRL